MKRITNINRWRRMVFVFGILELWTITAFGLLPIVAEGAVPQLINFQGILKDGSGNPVADGSYSVVFTIYDAPTGGNNLWSQTYNVTTSSGLFSILLGSGPIPIPDTTFNDSSRYLGIKVGADPEMTPRQRLSSAGYSYVSGQWTSADSNLFRLNGNIGIGASPSIYTKVRVSTSAFTPNNVTAVKGEAANTMNSFLSYGGYFTSTGTGVYGSGFHGVHGEATGGDGVYGSSSTGNGVYAYGGTNGVVGYGVGASSSPIYGCYSSGFNSSTGDAYGGYFIASTSGGGASYGVYGEGLFGVYGNSSSWIGGRFTGGVTGVGATGTNYGVNSFATEIGGIGVSGAATNTNGRGIYGVGGTYGVYGFSNLTGGFAVYGSTGGNTATYGGYFENDVRVTRNLVVDGSVFKGGGGFKIDDPTDPANKYLYHSFVESPDMKNIYDGVVTLNSRGEADVSLPNWFGAVNKDFRYQLTALGAPGPNLYIAEEISNNRFRIAGGTAGTKVSWQVTGIRKDAYAEAHRIPVVEEKPTAERGKYLHPEEAGVAATLGMHYEEKQKMAAEHKQMKEQQAKMEQERPLQEQKVKENQPNK